MLHHKTTTTFSRYILHVHIMTLIIIFASSIYSHVGVASHNNNNRPIASSNASVVNSPNTIVIDIKFKS